LLVTAATAPSFRGGTQRDCPYKYTQLEKLAQLQIIDYASRRLPRRR
jgi:hypothetical protein